jgi:hypothetical protein
MTYDQWKTTDPREYSHVEEDRDEPSELDALYDALWEVKEGARHAAEIATARIKKLEADLLECLEYFKKHYDVKDGDHGEQLPNEEMRLGTMVDETLYGIRF